MRLRALWPSRLRCLQQRVSPGVQSDFVRHVRGQDELLVSKEEYFSALPLSLVLGWQSLGGRHSSRALPARPQPAMVGTLEVDDDYVVTCRAAQRAVRYLLLSGAARARASAVHARTCAYRRQRGRQKGGGAAQDGPAQARALVVAGGCPVER